jgi:cytochrome c oxidase assembly protein subunit 15
VLIVAGALVTSNDAGLAVPDWPTSFGSLYKIPPMVGGIKFEHGHRMIAEFIGLLTIVLAVWTQRVETRKWMRVLGWTALGAVIAQGILGGITVKFFLPPWVSTAHATLAQTFFCIVASFALFTSRGWTESESADSAVRQFGNAAVADHKPSVRTLTLLAASSVYIQLILGAAFRHSGLKLLPHLISAVVVTSLILWTVTRVLSGFSAVTQLRRPATFLLGLLFAQLSLGFAAYLTRVEWGKDAPQPEAPMVWSTVAHVAVGALVLATTVILAIQAQRYAPKIEASRVSVPDGAPHVDKAVTA